MADTTSGASATGARPPADTLQQAKERLIVSAWAVMNLFMLLHMFFYIVPLLQLLSSDPSLSSSACYYRALLFAAIVYLLSFISQPIPGAGRPFMERVLVCMSDWNIQYLFVCLSMWNVTVPIITFAVPISIYAAYFLSSHVAHVVPSTAPYLLKMTQYQAQAQQLACAMEFYSFFALVVTIFFKDYSALFALLVYYMFLNRRYVGDAMFKAVMDRVGAMVDSSSATYLPPTLQGWVARVRSFVYQTCMELHRHNQPQQQHRQ